MVFVVGEALGGVFWELLRHRGNVVASRFGDSDFRRGREEKGVLLSYNKITVVARSELLVETTCSRSAGESWGSGQL
jgi:hypothetical protein